MIFSDIWNKSQEDYFIFVQQSGIVRFLLLFEQHAMYQKIYIFILVIMLPLTVISYYRKSSQASNFVETTPYQMC